MTRFMENPNGFMAYKHLLPRVINLILLTCAGMFHNMCIARQAQAQPLISHPHSRPHLP